jgi:hypothetical protein
MAFRDINPFPDFILGLPLEKNLFLCIIIALLRSSAASASRAPLTDCDKVRARRVQHGMKKG